MAGLLAIFAEFEREVLRERTRAGLAEARQNGKRLGRPETAARHASEDRDVRSDPTVGREILDLLRLHGVKSVVMTDRIIGCPHEQGADYPEGAVCPQCPFWAHRDRWTGEVIQ